MPRITIIPAAYADGYAGCHDEDVLCIIDHFSYERYLVACSERTAKWREKNSKHIKAKNAEKYLRRKSAMERGQVVG